LECAQKEGRKKGVMTPTTSWRGSGESKAITVSDNIPGRMEGV